MMFKSKYEKKNIDNSFNKQITEPTNLYMWPITLMQLYIFACMFNLK